MIGLNLYQRRCVGRLIDAGVKFLIIGGQARHPMNGDNDLDLWIDVFDGDNARALQRVVGDWLSEHPMHCALGVAESVARGLPPHKLISIPDERCAYLDDEHELAIISPDNGIDLLFGSIEGDAAGYVARAVAREAAPSLVISCMSEADAMAISRLEEFTARRREGREAADE